MIFGSSVVLCFIAVNLIFEVLDYLSLQIYIRTKAHADERERHCGFVLEVIIEIVEIPKIKI